MFIGGSLPRTQYRCWSGDFDTEGTIGKARTPKSCTILYRPWNLTFKSSLKHCTYVLCCGTEKNSDWIIAGQRRTTDQTILNKLRHGPVAELHPSSNELTYDCDVDGLDVIAENPGRRLILPSGHEGKFSYHGALRPIKRLLCNMTHGSIRWLRLVCAARSARSLTGLW